MSEKGILEWFGKRKEDSVSIGIRSHALVVLDSVMELNMAVAAMSRGDSVSAIKCVDRLILSEREADRTEDRLCADISGGELSVQEREDLIRFVRKMKQIANWAKEASLHIQLIKETCAFIPRDVWDGAEKMSAELIPTVKSLIKAIESLKSDYTETVRSVDNIVDQERIVDGLYYSNIKQVHLSDMAPKDIMLMRELILSMEMAADTCKTCADTISVLMISRRS